MHRQVPRADMIGIAVEHEAQAGDTYARLRQLNAPSTTSASLSPRVSTTPPGWPLAWRRDGVLSSPSGILQTVISMTQSSSTVVEERREANADHADRAEGALLAAAAGDALGWPIEPRGSRVGGTREVEPQLDFIAWDRREGGGYAPFVRHVPAGTYPSDDTQLAVAVARSLMHGEQWWRHFTELELPLWTLYELGGGGSVRRAAKSWERGVPPWSSDLKSVERQRYFDAGGNGVVMRVAPHAIAAIREESLSAAAHRIVADGLTTHGHPTHARRGTRGRIRRLEGAALAGKDQLWRARRTYPGRAGRMGQSARRRRPRSGLASKRG